MCLFLNCGAYVKLNCIYRNQCKHQQLFSYELQKKRDERVTRALLVVSFSEMFILFSILIKKWNVKQDSHEIAAEKTARNWFWNVFKWKNEAQTLTLTELILSRWYISMYVWTNVDDDDACKLHKIHVVVPYTYMIVNSYVDCMVLRLAFHSTLISLDLCGEHKVQKLTQAKDQRQMKEWGEERSILHSYIIGITNSMRRKNMRPIRVWIFKRLATAMPRERERVSAASLSEYEFHKLGQPSIYRSLFTSPSYHHHELCMILRLTLFTRKSNLRASRIFIKFLVWSFTTSINFKVISSSRSPTFARSEFIFSIAMCVCVWLPLCGQPKICSCSCHIYDTVWHDDDGLPTCLLWLCEKSVEWMRACVCVLCK